MQTSRCHLMRCFAIMACASMPAIAMAQAGALPAAPIDLKFDFGAGAAKAGYSRVALNATYTAEAGYGYEPGAQLAIGDDGKTTTSDKPFLFSAQVPEGNFNVTVTFGHSRQETTTTVKAESGRLTIGTSYVPERMEKRPVMSADREGVH